MKVLIVNPPSRSRVYGAVFDLSAIEIPVWAGILAEFLEDRGYNPEILDCECERLTIEESAKRIKDFSPDLAVFMVYGQQPSASTQCLPAAEAVAKECGVRTICIGTHPSALPYRTLHEGPWTYVCKGEGPLTVLGLLHVLEGMGRLEDVPGLWRRDGETIVGNPPARTLKTEELGRGLHHFDFRKYKAHNWHAFGTDPSPYASLQTSLGCPYKCSFCCINAPFGGNSYRMWSVESVMKDLAYLANSGVRNIKIPDEMFVLNKTHVEGICNGIIERGYDFNIWAYARVDTLKYDSLLEKLKRAGFNWLGIGIESASSYVRDGVEKGRFNNEKIEETIRRVQAKGINVGANYIFGLPDDDVSSMLETIGLANRLNTEWANFYCAMAYPGSHLYSQARERGWALPESTVGWIGYSQHSYETLPLPTEKLTAAEVLKFRDEAFTQYFTSPKYLELINQKFGKEAVQQVELMTAITLKRKLYEV